MKTNIKLLLDSYFKVERISCIITENIDLLIFANNKIDFITHFPFSDKKFVLNQIIRI